MDLLSDDRISRTFTYPLELLEYSVCLVGGVGRPTELSQTSPKLRLRAELCQDGFDTVWQCCRLTGS